MGNDLCKRWASCNSLSNAVGFCTGERSPWTQIPRKSRSKDKASPLGDWHERRHQSSAFADRNWINCGLQCISESCNCWLLFLFPDLCVGHATLSTENTTVTDTVGTFQDGSGGNSDDVVLDSIQRSGRVLFILAARFQSHSSEHELVGGCVRGNNWHKLDVLADSRTEDL